MGGDERALMMVGAHPPCRARIAQCSVLQRVSFCTEVRFDQANLPFRCRHQINEGRLFGTFLSRNLPSSEIRHVGCGLDRDS
jgi:hypothetical protein